MAEQLNIETKVYSTFEVAEIVLKALDEERIVGGSYGNADYRCAVGWLLDLSTCKMLDSREYRKTLPSYPFADVLVERGFISVVGPVPNYAKIYAEHTAIHYPAAYDHLFEKGARFLRIIQNLVDGMEFGAVRGLCEATLALKPEFTKKEVATLVLHKLEVEQIRPASYLCSSGSGKRCAIGWLLPHSVAYDIENTAAGYVLADDLVWGNRLIITDGDANWARVVQSRVDNMDFNNLKALLKKELI